MGDQPKVDNLLHISWNDSRWMPPLLTSSNVLDYFSERSNPFYSRECNNEFIKMQQNTRLDQLQHMTGTEYMLLHAQEPILYIIRKQHRNLPNQVIPQAAYHVIGGQVFQTPDLGSIINSRLASSVHHLNSAFGELQSLANYHSSKGYYWQTTKFSKDETDSIKKANKKKSRKEEVASIFQRRRVDLLLGDLTAKFPPKLPPSQTVTDIKTTQPPSQAQSIISIKSNDTKPDVKPDIKFVKTESKDDIPLIHRGTKPPPEKRAKLGI